jgi:hypothetical protein
MDYSTSFAQDLGRLTNSTDTLGQKIDRSNRELGETKAIIETAGKKVSEATIASAGEVSSKLGVLIDTLTQTSSQLQTASAQSSRLSMQLNWLTTALVFAAILTAGATIFQACETRRQADLSEKQLHTAVPGRQPATAVQPTPSNLQPKQ